VPGDRCGERLSTLARLGPLESRVVEIVWRRRAPVSVRDVQRDLSGLAYTTVMTTLVRLYDKGVLTRERERRAYEHSDKHNNRNRNANRRGNCYPHTDRRRDA